MPNPAARKRQERPGRAVKARDRYGLVFAHPDFPDLPPDVAGEWVGVTGPIHALRPGGNPDVPDDWDELDSGWQPDGGAFDHRTTLLDYETVARVRENVAANPYQVERLGQSILFSPANLQWRNGSNQLDFIATPAGTTTVPADGPVRWADAYGAGVDVEVVPHISGRVVKHLHIADAASLPAPSLGGTVTLEWQIGFTASGGLTPYLSDGSRFSPRNNTTTLIPDGVIEWRTDSGEVMGYFVKPRAWDSSELPRELPVEMRIRRQGNSLNAWLRVTKADLDAATYPVVIDPTYEVTAGDDDAWCLNQDVGTMNKTADYGLMGWNTSGNPYDSIMRFLSVAIPNAATITAASLELVAEYTQGTALNSTLKLNDVDSAAAIPTQQSDFNNLARTTGTAYNSVPAWTVGTAYTTADFSSEVQEVVDRAGWASGNNMSVIWEGESTTGTQYRGWANYEDATYDPAALTITYSASSPTTVTLGLATAATSAKALSVSNPPPATTVTLGLATAATAAHALAVTLLAPPQTVTLGVATAASAANPLTITGALTLTLGTATATTTAPALSVSSGAAPQTVTLGVATATTAAPALSITGSLTLTLATATATTAAPALAVTQGAAPQTVTLGLATATTAAPSLDVTQGGAPQTVTLGTATAATAAPSLSVSQGTVVTLGVATATAQVPSTVGTDAHFTLTTPSKNIESDAALAFPTQDFTVIIKMAHDWQTGSGTEYLYGNHAGGSDVSIYGYISGSAAFRELVCILYHSDSSQTVMTDGAVIDLDDGETLWWKLTRRDSDGYVKSEISTNGVDWDAYDDKTSTTVDLRSVTEKFFFGAIGSLAFGSDIELFEGWVYDGYDGAGSLVLHADASDYESGSTFTTDTFDWIVNGSPAHTPDTAGGTGLEVILANTITLATATSAAAAHPLSVSAGAVGQTVTLGVATAAASAHALRWPRSVHRHPRRSVPATATATANSLTVSGSLTLTLDTASATSVAHALTPLGSLVTVVITVREVGAFYRNTTQGTLALVWGFPRTRAVGYKAADGWQRISSKFRFNGTDSGRAVAYAAVASTWAGHSGDDQATLTTLMDTALQASGFRANDGSVLV